jgi:hypothetical protein
MSIENLMFSVLSMDRIVLNCENSHSTGLGPTRQEIKRIGLFSMMLDLFWKRRFPSVKCPNPSNFLIDPLECAAGIEDGLNSQGEWSIAHARHPRESIIRNSMRKPLIFFWRLIVVSSNFAMPRLAFAHRSTIRARISILQKTSAFCESKFDEATDHIPWENRSQDELSLFHIATIPPARLTEWTVTGARKIIALQKTVANVSMCHEKVQNFGTTDRTATKIGSRKYDMISKKTNPVFFADKDRDR